MSHTPASYQAKGEHLLAMAALHLNAAEFFREQGPKHREDMNAAYRLADKAAAEYERLYPNGHRAAA